MPGKLSKEAALRFKAREDARLIISHRLQLELRMPPRRAGRLAASASKSLVQSLGTDVNAAALTRDELRTIVAEAAERSREQRARRSGAAAADRVEPHGTPAAAPAIGARRSTPVDQAESKEAAEHMGGDGGMARGQRTTRAPPGLEAGSPELPAPKMMLHKPHTDMWSGLSLVDETINDLDAMAKSVEARQKKESFRVGLDEQRQEQRRFREAELRADEQALRLAQSVTEAEYAARSEAQRRKQSRSKKFLGDVALLQHQIQAQKLTERERRAEEARSELEKVRAAARFEQASAVAKRHAQRCSVRETQLANHQAIQWKLQNARSRFIQEAEELQRADAELEAREQARLAVVEGRRQTVQRKLAAMGGTFVDPATVDREAAERATREMEERHREQDERAQSRDEKRKRILKHEREFLLEQMREHDEGRRARRAGEREQLRRAEADATAAAEEARRRREEDLVRRRKHGTSLVAQMQATTAAAMAPDDSALERRLNRNVLKMRQAELEAKAAEVLRNTPQRMLQASGVMDKVRHQAERLGGFQDSPLSSSAAGILRKLDATVERFASPGGRKAARALAADA